jgi:hypothetical protein
VGKGGSVGKSKGQVVGGVGAVAAVVGGVGAVVAEVGGVGAAAVGSGVTGSRPHGTQIEDRSGQVRLERISVGFQHGPGQNFAGQTKFTRAKQKLGGEPKLFRCGALSGAQIILASDYKMLYFVLASDREALNLELFSVSQHIARHGFSVRSSVSNI